MAVRFHPSCKLRTKSLRQISLWNVGCVLLEGETHSIVLRKSIRKQQINIIDLKVEVGDHVLLCFHKTQLKSTKGKTWLFPNLSMRYYGPFRVIDKINDVAFRLELHVHWTVHNSFHVSLLKPFQGEVPKDLP